MTTQLAEFQIALIELLNTQLSVAEIQHHLRNDPAFLPYQKYVENFDPKMIETAAELAKKWSVRY